MRLATLVVMTVVCLLIARMSEATPDTERLALIAALLCGALALLEAIIVSDRKKGR